MDVFECLKRLTQTKDFKKKKVNDKLIGVMLYMATQVISAGDVQEWQFIVVRDEEKKKRLYEAALKQRWVKEADLDIVVCADLEKVGLKYGKRGEILYAVEDVSFATLAIALSATALGLGTYVVQAFDEDSVKMTLSLPDNLRPIFIIAVGYPAKEPEKKKRIMFDNLTWVDDYGRKYEISYYVQPGVTKEPIPLSEILKGIAKRIKRKH